MKKPLAQTLGARLAAWFTIGSAVACSNPAGPTIPDFVNCSVFAESRTSAYVLPFPVGQRFRVSRTFDHYTTGNQGVGLYAVDIDMPIGTVVHAMRAGTVVAVEEAFSNDDHATYHENWVMIRHADNTVARYIHLTTGGAFVEVGQAVTQGQVIGASGNSGASNGPHLHFDVQTCGPNLPPGYNTLPCGMTAPMSFRNTEAQSCGLTAKKSYTALAYDPESR